VLVRVGVRVGVEVAVGVGVAVGVEVAVGIGVKVGVAVGVPSRCTTPGEATGNWKTVAMTTTRGRTTIFT
jgi:hypothetical protein